MKNEEWHVARKLLGWPKRCKLAHAILWEHSYKRLKLAQLLGQLGVFLTWIAVGGPVWLFRFGTFLCSVSSA